MCHYNPNVEEQENEETSCVDQSAARLGSASSDSSGSVEKHGTNGSTTGMSDDSEYAPCTSGGTNSLMDDQLVSSGAFGKLDIKL